MTRQTLVGTWLIVSVAMLGVPAFAQQMDRAAISRLLEQ